MMILRMMLTDYCHVAVAVCDMLVDLQYVSSSSLIYKKALIGYSVFVVPRKHKENKFRFFRHFLSFLDGRMKNDLRSIHTTTLLMISAEYDHVVTVAVSDILVDLQYVSYPSLWYIRRR